MTNIEALKDLYVAMGGNADNFTAQTIPEALELIKTVLPVGLPKVSATNNGKILKVVDGNWALEADATE